MWNRLLSLNTLAVFIYLLVQWFGTDHDNVRQFFYDHLLKHSDGTTIWLWSPLWLVVLRAVLKLVFRI
jgi:hypothetical protein